MEDTFIDNLRVPAESIEQLNMETTHVPIIFSVRSDQQVDGFDDLWCEDGLSNDISDDSFGDASLLNREWKRRQTHFHTMGYRDGVLAGKEVSAQDGFNAGFKQSVKAGYNWGLVRGITSALAVLPDNLKEKLMGTHDISDRFQKLYVSAQNISSSDALQMFHNSIQKGSLLDTDEDHCSSHYKELTCILHKAPDLKVTAELI